MQGKFENLNFVKQNAKEQDINRKWNSRKIVCKLSAVVFR